MKKIIFSFLITLLSVSVHSQVSNPPTQLNYFKSKFLSGAFGNNSNPTKKTSTILFKPLKEVVSDWDPFGNQWYYSDSTRNSYNSTGNITKKLWYQGFSTDPEKNIYVYNGNGKLIVDTGLHWNGSSYIINSLNTYMYDANGNKTQEIHYNNWTGSSWLNGAKRDYTYDTNNNQIQSLTQDLNTGIWVNSYKDNYTWNAGIVTQQISQTWNSVSWDNSYRADYIHSGGQLSSFTSYLWNGATWDVVSKLNNMVWYQWFGFFDDNTKLAGFIEQVPNGTLWKDTLKLTLTYDSYGNQTDYLYQSKPGSTYITVDEFKDFYQYNSNTSVTEDIQQNWNTSTQITENFKKKEYSDFFQYSTNSCVPNQPGPVSGNSSVTAGSIETYSVAPVSGATTYSWTLAAGYSGNSTSNSINVTIGSANGAISVVAQNSCGVSPASSILLSVPGTTTVTQVSLCVPYEFKDIAPSFFCNINGMMLIGSSQDGLWKSDGTTAGTIKINAAPQYAQGPFAVLGNTAYFKSGMQLWKTDGTEAGTVMVMDIPNATYLGNLTPAGNSVFFLVKINNATITKLWKTDGTTAGTSIVKDIDPSNSSYWDPRYLFAYNNNIYFKAGNSTYGMELWKSDGTAISTVVVKDVNPGPADGSYSLGYSFEVYNNELYYYGGYASTGQFSYGLWKTNGTDPGTMLVRATSFMDNLKEVNGLLYFFAFDEGGISGNSLYGQELWRSDGTTAGTYMVKDIKPGSVSGISSGSQFGNINGKIVFGASDGTTGIELWASDGTTTGTSLLKDIYPGSQSSIGNYFTASEAINGYIYFSATNGTIGSELWVTDGTSSGTFLVSDIWPGTNGSVPWNFNVFNGNLYFAAEQSSFNYHLWSCGNFAGIQNLLDNQTVSVYPNPGTGVFKIKSEKEFVYNSIKIYNTQGQLIYQSNKPVEEIDLTTQPKGIYFVQINSEGTIGRKKIIIQ